MLDGQLLKISEGNSKIGKIPNLSLPPVTTCRPDAPCAQQGCYAAKFYRMYPNVRNAWDSNLRLLQGDPDKFFYDLTLYLAVNKPERFRLFVSGDFPNELFFIQIMDIFSSYPETRVLCFTKRYDYPLYLAPENVNLILSMWPEATHIRCLSNCVECGYKCFHAVSRELHCVFDRH